MQIALLAAALAVVPQQQVAAPTGEQRVTYSLHGWGISIHKDGVTNFTAGAGLRVDLRAFADLHLVARAEVSGRPSSSEAGGPKLSDLTSFESAEFYGGAYYKLLEVAASGIPVTLSPAFVVGRATPLNGSDVHEDQETLAGFLRVGIRNETSVYVGYGRHDGAAVCDDAGECKNKGFLAYGILTLHRGLKLLVDFAIVEGQTYLRWGPQLGLSW